MKKPKITTETPVERHPLYPYRDINGHLLPGHPKFGGHQRKTPDDLFCTFEEYRKEMGAQGKTLTIQSFVARLGLTKTHFRLYYGKDPIYEEVIMYIMAHLEDDFLQFSLGGKAQVLALSYFKNFFEWSDDKTLFLAGIKNAPPIGVTAELVSLGRRLSGIKEDPDDRDV